jgi:hypothetical protein
MVNPSQQNRTTFIANVLTAILFVPYSASHEHKIFPCNFGHQLCSDFASASAIAFARRIARGGEKAPHAQKSGNGGLAC